VVSIEELTDELRDRLKEVVKRNPAEGLLFSGGLDSGVLASLSLETKAFTITLEGGGEDLEYAQILAKFLELQLYHEAITTDEALNAIPTVIGILKTFDPAIPNDITTYFALKFAKDKGIKRVMTGDGGDELFAGYSYMEDLSDLDDYLLRLTKKMFFSSNILAQVLGLEVVQPFLDRRVVEFAIKIPASLKVKQDGGKRFGKWILRKAFEGLLPDEIIWQSKRPLEHGSGTTRLRAVISSKIPDEEFQIKQGLYPIKFMNREHLFYYEIYREVVGGIPGPCEGQIGCQGCGAGMEKEARHCRICGMTVNG